MIAGVPTTYTQDLAAPLPVVLQSQTGENAMRYVYALGTRPLAQHGSAWEYLLADALGSVRQIVDANGKVTLAKSYEPYGSVLTSTGTASSIFAYGGEQIDTSGLVFLRARYMNPRLGVFLARDPWGGDQLRPGSMNGWNYGDDNPVNRVDPSGRFSAVAIANGFFNQPTVVGFDRVAGAFYAMSRHLGWISLLLDADESQYVYNWSNLTHREPYGKIKCDEDGQSITRVNEPYTAWRTATDATLFNTNKIPRPRPELGRWWRENGVYSLVNGSEEKFYFDKGDDGHTTDLPDYMVMIGGNLTIFGGAAIQDRFGNVYANGNIGVTLPTKIPGGAFYGEGYVYTRQKHVGPLRLPFLIVQDEKELMRGIKGWAAAIGASGIFGMGLTASACPDPKVPCYDAVVFSTGLQLGLGGSFGGTDGPTVTKSNESWDWMLYKSGPSREEVWRRWLKSVADNPCGGCSAAK